MCECRDVATFSKAMTATRFDLTGVWRLGYMSRFPDRRRSGRVPPSTMARPMIQAPGNDVMMFLKKSLRSFAGLSVSPSAWLNNNGRVWLYVWDLNSGEHLKEKIVASVNGTVIGEDLTRHATSHWSAFEAGRALRAGTNTVAIRVPKGQYQCSSFRARAVTVSRITEGEEARWVDFSDWRQETRTPARRGMEAIRSADPDRSIICMAPDSSISGVKKLCEQYGAHFHNTGHMGGSGTSFCRCDAARTCRSAEPGGPADSLQGFKRMLGFFYFTEGVQAIHYFIHVGNIYWASGYPRPFREDPSAHRQAGGVQSAQGRNRLALQRPHRITSPVSRGDRILT